MAPVLKRYGAPFDSLRWVPLGSGGGFSGAELWRGEGEGVPLFALKAWPRSMAADRLAEIHRWMAKASHLEFVPEVMKMRDGSTLVEASGRIWDLTRWMPGTADYHANPGAPRLANACTALAELHRAWRPASPRFTSCPAVARRLQILANWRAADIHLPMPLDLLRRGSAAVARLIEPAERALRPCADRPVLVQPCLCDIWHDHILFSGAAVTGIIDFGAMKEDHLAVDLARMLGDLAGEDEEKFHLGLNAYRAASGETDLPYEFVRLLDRTGVVCSMIVWLLRWTANSRQFAEDRAAVDRVERVVDRIEAIRGCPRFPPS
jgi:Ser/Thr protein kinase RdoA (MazF antagonist)